MAANPFSMRRQIRNLSRYRQIAALLVRHGFYDFVSHSDVFSTWGIKRRLLRGVPPEDLPETRWQRVRRVLEELGPAYIKLGQFLSNRPDIVPRELSLELEKLLDSVPPFPPEKVREIFRKDFGIGLEDGFAEFDEFPFSSASIAQVHRARLKSGENLAVKVQRPDIRRMIESDLDIMTHLARMLAGFLDDASAIEPERIISEFKAEISKELDFSRELANIERFQAKFKNDRRIHVPMVFRELSSRRVLTMEFVDGVQLKRFEELKDLDQELLLKNLTELVFAQIFEHGYFHADPHPANILILDKSVVCFVDFGLIGILSPREREQLTRMITAVIQGKSRDLSRAILRLCPAREDSHIGDLENEVFKLVDYYAYLPLQDVKLGNFFNDVFKLIARHRLHIPLDVYLLTKTLTTLEGTARRIKPDFNPLIHIEPLVRKRLLHEWSPWHFLQDFYHSLRDYGALAGELPDEIRDLIRQLKQRKMKIQFEHKGLEPMLKAHNQISNRISFSIITAAMMIGSSLIIHADIAPRVYDIPLIGLLAFSVAMLMSLMLLWAIIRHGRL